MNVRSVEPIPAESVHTEKIQSDNMPTESNIMQSEAAARNETGHEIQDAHVALA